MLCHSWNSACFQVYLPQDNFTSRHFTASPNLLPYHFHYFYAPPHLFPRSPAPLLTHPSITSLPSRIRSGSLQVPFLLSPLFLSVLTPSTPFTLSPATLWALGQGQGSNPRERHHVAGRGALQHPRSSAEQGWGWLGQGAADRSRDFPGEHESPQRRCRPPPPLPAAPSASGAAAAGGCCSVSASGRCGSPGSAQPCSPPPPAPLALC